MLKTQPKSTWDSPDTSDNIPLLAIVDDQQDIADLLGIMLEKQGYRIVKYYNSGQAISEIEQGRVKPDLLLFDVMMPGLSGFDLTRRVRANPELSHIPIILLTAAQDDKARSTGLEAGADEFLSKPVNRIELAARVRSLVRLKQATEELRRKTEENRRLNDELRLKNAQMAKDLESMLARARPGTGRLTI